MAPTEDEPLAAQAPFWYKEKVIDQGGIPALSLLTPLVHLEKKNSGL